MMNTLPIRLKETTTITKFAPGVNPHDPASVPEEVIVKERYLSDDEIARLFGAMEQEQMDKQMRTKQE
jgi:hypothetical protein